jgi:hypothetical protein
VEDMFVNGPSIDASYQVSVHLAMGFQRRRLKCEKLTDEVIPQKNVNDIRNLTGVKMISTVRSTYLATLK